MTIPYLMNCSHSGEGWCLDCTKELGEAHESLKAENDRLHRQVASLKAERAALVKLIIVPWTRPDDGARLVKINLAWQETTDTLEEAIAYVCKAAGLDPKEMIPA